MRVLIACEFSGIVRDAFIAKGHDAISCDLLPSERQGPHYKFHHGHGEWKSTCLWIKNLTPLKSTLVVEPERKLCGGKKPGRITSRLHRLPPSKTRWIERSRTFPGIATAMAEQWG